MNSKTLAATTIFTALTVALNLSPFKFPAPYAPFLYYQIWEIPIVVAFLLFGPETGTFISIINTAALLVLFPGALPTGPIYNLIASLGMLAGILGAHWLMNRVSKRHKEVTLTVIATLFGVILRVIVMSFVNWAFIRYPPPIGFSMPEEAIIAIIPFVAFFNASLAIYTIPAGYVLAKTISHSIKTNMWSP